MNRQRTGQILFWLGVVGLLINYSEATDSLQTQVPPQPVTSGGESA